MRRFFTSNPFVYTAGLTFVFALWLLISATLGAGSLIFPSPIATFAALGEMLSDSYIYDCLGRTLLRTLEGFGISFAMALVLGSLAGHWTWLQRFFKPGLIVLKSAPTAAFVFLFLILSGASQAPIYIVVILAFPILYEAVVGGINAIPKQLIYAARIDAASPLSMTLRIRIPLAVPFIVLGVMSSFALSFKTTIMAEIIAGDTKPGLGSAIANYRALDPTNLAPIFAIAFSAIVVVLLMDVLSLLAKKAFGKR